MSKDQKKTVELPVEIVENLQEKLEWISSTISFWHFNNAWPMNIIKDICEKTCDELELEWLKDFQNVSVSHIIDK